MLAFGHSVRGKYRYFYAKNFKRYKNMACFGTFGLQIVISSVNFGAQEIV